MDELDRFYKELHEMRNQRVGEEQAKRREHEMLGENIYTRYWVWCQATRKGRDTDNAKVFRQYLKNNDITLTFWQRKYLAETYFGCTCAWNAEQQKWITKRRNHGNQSIDYGAVGQVSSARHIAGASRPIP